MARPKIYHFYGELDGVRYVAPCTVAPHDEWRCTNDVKKVNCPGCLAFIRDCTQEMPH